MSTLSGELTRALAAERRREALATAQAYRASAALRWQRRAAKAAHRAERERAAL